MLFGQRLKMIREKKGYSPEFLAASLGVSVSMIDKLERGSRGTTLNRTKQLADFYKMSIEELVGDSELPGRIKSVKDQAENDKAALIQKALSEDVSAKELEEALNFLRSMKKA